MLNKHFLIFILRMEIIRKEEKKCNFDKVLQLRVDADRYLNINFIILTFFF